MPPPPSYPTLLLLAAAAYFVWMDARLLSRLIFNNSNGNATDDVMSVKELFQGPTIQYVDEPLAASTVAAAEALLLLSPNAASLLGVAFSFAAARLFVSDSLRTRQLGVLLFKVRKTLPTGKRHTRFPPQVRDYFDSLDGAMARRRRHQTRMTVEPGTFGYYFDGLCDAAADAALFLALWIFLFRNAETTLPLDARRQSFWRSALPTVRPVALVAGQVLLSAVAWNVALLRYTALLDMTTLRSPAMWLVVFLWRLLNPHSLTQFVLLAIVCDRTKEYFSAVRLLGYAPVVLVALLSRTHAASIEAALTTS